jgi:HD-like signal output (HDOD) protein
MTRLPATPPRNLRDWADYLSRIEIPVLPDTAAALAALADDEENTDAQAVATLVMRDPMMCVKLYRHLASLRRGSQLTDVESVTGCLVMIGIPPFFRRFASLETIAPEPGQTQSLWPGLAVVLRRAQRAADFAFEWAVRRNDLDAEIIGTAALLHDFAEMLIWSLAPALAAEVDRQLEQHPGMRSVEAQKAVLGTGINELQHELMLRWRLPELLVRITDDHAGGDPQVRTVQLAVALARHSTHGWDNPALPDDYAALGELLNVSPLQARLMVAEDDAPNAA